MYEQEVLDATETAVEDKHFIYVNLDRNADSGGVYCIGKDPNIDCEDAATLSKSDVAFTMCPQDITEFTELAGDTVVECVHDWKGRVRKQT